MLWSYSNNWIIMSPMNPIQLLQFISIRTDCLNGSLKLWRLENWTFKWNFAVYSFYFLSTKYYSSVNHSLTPAHCFCSVFILFVSFSIFIFCFEPAFEPFKMLISTESYYWVWFSSLFHCLFAECPQLIYLLAINNTNICDMRSSSPNN